MLDRFRWRNTSSALVGRLARRSALLLAGSTLAFLTLAPASAFAAQPAARHTVGFDKYSLTIDGQRRRRANDGGRESERLLLNA